MLFQHAASIKDIAFRDDFEAGRVSPADFTHRQHLRLAYVNLCDQSLDAAHIRIRTSINQLLVQNGLDTGNYHETLTLSWLKAVQYFMTRSAKPFQSADQFMADSAIVLDSKAMLTHYSSDRLFSEAARSRFLEPDLQPIPAG